MKLQKLTIVYTFKHSKMGFQNSITVEALNYEQAIEKARKEISDCYGSDMLKRFLFK
jgi:hypothetical protein